MTKKEEPLVSEPMRAIETIEPPAFEMPRGACDIHMHVFGPENVYPHVSHPHYTLPDGRLDHYRLLMERLGLERFVIVQPSFYGTDNRCLLDALARSGEAARGVVMVEDYITTAELERFHMLGVRGVRLDLFMRADMPRTALEAYVTAMARKVAPLGWHLQFYAPGWVVRDLIDFLRTLDIRYVIDHMGYMLEKDGLTNSDFERLLSLMQTGNCWLKLSAPYRLAAGQSYEAVEGVARAIIDAAPHRALWGSDWPHIPTLSRDTGELLNLLTRWTPDAATRRLVLADNAARLFDFAES